MAPDAETIRKLTITAQPAAPTSSIADGYTQLGIATPRDAYVYVPPAYDPAVPAPLLVLLHQAGGDRSVWATTTIEGIADGAGLIVLAVDSRYPTWDVLQTGAYDVDVAFLNQALLHVFERVNVDPVRVAIGGFSDGASEALGIGIANAGLFRKIIAFSPGALILPFSRGSPDVFVSHGDADPVISIITVRDNIVPRLRSNGMAVQFLTFQGGHAMPAAVQLEAFNWLLGP